jgi:hypothetical protein
MSRPNLLHFGQCLGTTIRPYAFGCPETGLDASHPSFNCLSDKTAGCPPYRSPGLDSQKALYKLGVERLGFEREFFHASK